MRDSKLHSNSGTSIICFKKISCFRVLVWINFYAHNLKCRISFIRRLKEITAKYRAIVSDSIGDFCSLFLWETSYSFLIANVLFLVFICSERRRFTYSIQHSRTTSYTSFLLVSEEKRGIYSTLLCHAKNSHNCSGSRIAKLAHTF